jgi:hypothetical protein
MRRALKSASNARLWVKRYNTHMRSGLNIEDGVYIEEPVRARVDLPVSDGTFIFDGKNVWRKQYRQPPAFIDYEAIRRQGTDYCDVPLQLVWFQAHDATESRDRQPVLPKLWRAAVTRSHTTRQAR